MHSVLSTKIITAIKIYLMDNAKTLDFDLAIVGALPDKEEKSLSKQNIEAVIRLTIACLQGLTNTQQLLY